MKASRDTWIWVVAPVVVAIIVLALGRESSGSDDRQFFGLWRSRYMALAALLLWAAGGAAAARHSARRLFAFLFACLLAGMAVFFLEVIGQLGLVSYAELMGNRRYLPTNDMGASARPHLEASGMTFQDTALNWGIDHEPIPFTYRTDGRGFRNPVDREAADVYLLGDSIVVGGLVPFPQTMAGRLEEAWSRPVMNVALIGIGIEQEQALFRRASLPLDGRLVLQFLFEGNDLLDAARAEAAAEDEAASQIEQRSFVKNAELALLRLTQPEVGLASRRSCQLDGRRYLFRWTWNSFMGVEDRQAALFGSIASFAEEVHAAGGEYALVFVPAKLRVVGPFCERWPQQTDLRDAIDRNPLRDSAERFAAEAGIPWIDLTDPLRRSAREGEIPWFWGDTHWNEIGHRVAADAIRQTPVVREWAGS